MRLVRIAAQPARPAPLPAAAHLSVLDQGPVIPQSRKDRARTALGRVGIVPATQETPTIIPPLTTDPGAPDGGY